MRKYRRSSLPDGGGFDVPRNPVPWMAKLMIGIVILLAVIFILLLIFRRDKLPWMTSIYDRFQSRVLKTETSLPVLAEASPIPTPTFPPGSPWLVAINITTIFSEPGEENPRIGILEGGDKARIVGKNVAGDWWAIRVPYVEGGVGWVNDAQVQAYDASGVTELVENQPDTEIDSEATPREDLPIVQAIANTNVRSGPGLEFVKIGLLSEGQEAEILGKDPEEFWWMIKIKSVEGERGWVARDYVVARNTNDVPVIGTSSIQFGAIPSPPPGAPTLSSALVINIRAGPGTNFAIIGKLAPDQKTEIVGVSTDGAWWAIKIPSAQNQRGWVSSEYATVENAEGVPVLR